VLDHTCQPATLPRETSIKVGYLNATLTAKTSAVSLDAVKRNETLYCTRSQRLTDIDAADNHRPHPGLRFVSLRVIAPAPSNNIAPPPLLLLLRLL